MEKKEKNELFVQMFLITGLALFAGVKTYECNDYKKIYEMQSDVIGQQQQVNQKQKKVIELQKYVIEGEQNEKS